MKYCRRCKTEKSLLDFNKCSSKKDGLQSCCRDCSKKLNNEGYTYNKNRRNSIKERMVEISTHNRKMINRYKRICKCFICSESEPVALDLHHLDPRNKDGHPSKMIKYSTESLKKEVRKCVVLCSNCHRKVHAELITLLIPSCNRDARFFQGK